jgi:hypothetical protein
MNSQLTFLAAGQHVADLYRAAERARVASDSEGRTSRSRSAVVRDCPVTIRCATDADLASIRGVALLDNQRPPRGPALVAEVAGEVVAVFAIDSSTVVANPFKPTADAVALLRLRAEQLTAPPAPSRRSLRRLRPRHAAAEA